MIIRENLKTKLMKPKDVATCLSRILKKEHEVDRDKEHFWVIGLDSKNSARYIELVSLGGLTSVPLAPRETFRLAIKKAVASIICAHNHPSGASDPSHGDKTVNDKLREAGEIIGIKLLDHIIIGDREYYSFQQDGRGRF